MRERASTQREGVVSGEIGSSTRSVSMSESTSVPGVPILAKTRRRRGSSRDQIHQGTSSQGSDDVSSNRTARSGMGRARPRT